jgi:8-amino-7-oxononanoate synthase
MKKECTRLPPLMECWERWRSIVEKRRERGLLREIKDTSQLIDFSSNDYFSFTKNKEIHNSITRQLQLLSERWHGSTGSRLLSGNSAFASQLEQFLANHHGAMDCLLFNSGFDANVGLFSTIASPADVILYDEKIHASVHDGIRQSRCGQATAFKHNDTAHLRHLIKQTRDRYHGTIFIAVESCYSMDGDVAPLHALVSIKNQFDNIEIIVDEAHAVGVYGAQGRGLVSHHRLDADIHIRIVTFGKAMGCHGACILCPSILKTFLLNYARPLIFSTFLPMYSLLSIQESYRYLAVEYRHLQSELYKRVEYFKANIGRVCDSSSSGIVVLDSESQIQAIVVKGNNRVLFLSQQLSKKGLDVRPIRSPTVPRDQERLRICIHCHNTFEQIDYLIDSIRDVVCHLDTVSATTTVGVVSKL